MSDKKTQGCEEVCLRRKSDRLLALGKSIGFIGISISMMYREI